MSRAHQVDLRFCVLFNSISVNQDDGQLIMKSCVQWKPITTKKILPQRDMNPGPLVR